MTTFYNTFNDTETQVAPGESSPHSEERSVTVRAGSGVVSYQGGEASSVDTYAAVNSSDLIASNPLQAKTPWGSPVSGELKPDHIVTIDGREMQVSVAERLGLLERDVHGRHVLVPQGAQKLSQEAPEAPVEEGEALQDASVEASLADLAASISPGTQVAIAQQIITDGMVNPNTIARAAGESSQEPGALSERINTVVQGFQAQTDSMLRSLGAEDTSLFYAWAQENHPQELRKAMTAHVMERTTKGYAPLFNSYVESLGDHSPEDILNASFGGGITAQQVGKKILLNIPGQGQMDYRTAVRQGFITVRGA